MKKNFVFLLFAMLVLVFCNSSWAQCPEDALDLGICDTLYVVPCSTTDTCYVVKHPFPDTICINKPGEKFPCFMYVHLFVTHDSNTYWWEDQEIWIQDSIKAFVLPLIFWHQEVSGMDADSVIFPYEFMSWNNIDVNPFFPWMDRSMFRHFVDPSTGDTVYNRMLQMVEAGKTAWTMYDSPDIDTFSCEGDSGYVPFSSVHMSATAQAWGKGGRVLLATYTFKVFMAEGDTTEICFDSTFWPPGSQLTLIRNDGAVYFPRHLLPKCFKVFGGGTAGVRWIESSTEEENRPTSFSVSQNYPNPFNPVTNFRVALPQASHVKIEVFNILGQRVKTLVNEDMRPGAFVVDWDGNDDRGVGVSSGIYFYRIVAGEFSDIKKMVLLK